MAIPGVYTLCSFTITSAITDREFTEIPSLEGMSRVTLEAEFSGTGGSTAVALIRSRMGTGGTWREIASIDFAAAGAKSSTVVTTGATPAAFSELAANTVLHWLGTELQAVATTTGTWANSVLTVRAHVT